MEVNESYLNKRIDDALRANREMESFLGIDSTKEQIREVRSAQRRNLLFLKDIDKEKYDRLTENK